MFYRVWSGVESVNLIWPHLSTRRGGCDGLAWPHLHCSRVVVGACVREGRRVRSRVELFEAIRRDARREELSIRGLAGRSPEEVYIAQVHEPGAQAEVDFADLWIIYRGVKTKVFLFTLRCSYSGKAVHRAFESQCQESFLEGHVHAFEQLGGVPVTHIRYDNLKSAVTRVLFGRTRIESTKWITFRSHYGFDAFYCRPGKEGAHEKGGVEVEGGRFRRNHLVPMPRVDSIAELNALLAVADARDDHRRLEGRTVSVATDFALEAPLLRPLPDEAFETGTTLTPRVDRHSRVSVRQTYYSVPARFIGARLRTLLRADEVLVFDGARVVARHERSRVRGGQVLVLDHYLEVLTRKPGALPGSMALSQARAAGVFTVAHEAFWTKARARHGDSDATRALIEVLLLHRHLPTAAVITGIRAAVSVGSTSPELVAVEARRAATQPRTADPDTDPDPDAAAADAVVLTLPLPATAMPNDGLGDPADHETADGAGDERQADVAEVVLQKLAGLPGERPLPSVAHYDELLSGGSARSARGAPEQASPAP